MTPQRKRSKRRAAIIRELASLGCRNTDIARLTGLTRTGVYLLTRREGIELPKGYRETPLQKAIREGYAAGIPPAEIAKQTGAKLTSVRVIASKHKVEGRVFDPYRFKRGGVVADECRDDYRNIMRKGYSATEAARMVPLLPLGAGYARVATEAEATP